MNKFRVACFQTTSSDIAEENIIMLEKIFSKVKRKHFDLICLPECVSIFSDSKTKINDYFDNWHQVFINFIEKKGLDDAVGAISVHGVCGAWGVLAVAIFDTTDGLIYGGFSLFVPQIIGMLAIAIWAFITSFIVLKTIDSLIGLRVTPEEEIAGLDASEHGTAAYGDFILKK